MGSKGAKRFDPILWHLFFFFTSLQRALVVFLSVISPKLLVLYAVFAPASPNCRHGLLCVCILP